MSETCNHRTLPNGKNIFTKTWLPEGEARANIILVHGIGEHCRRYEHVAKFLTDHGLAVYGFDHIGHGESDGARGCMSYKDGFDIIDLFKEELKEKPVFVYGHSMGGGIVLAYGTQHPQDVTGIIATGPAVGIANPLNPAVVKVLRLLKKIAPGFAISNGLSTAGLSHDPEVEKAYVSDPLVHDKVSVQLGLDLMDWGEFLQHYSETYPVPLLEVQGSEDTLVDPVAAEKFGKNLKGDVTYRRFEGGYHELHNEPNKEELFKLMIDWIDRVLQDKSSEK